jgi:hypothetical protein
MRNNLNISSNEYKDFISTLGLFLDWMRTFMNEVYFKYGLIFPFNPDEIMTTLTFTENQMHILIDIEDNADQFFEDEYLDDNLKKSKNI